MFEIEASLILMDIVRGEESQRNIDNHHEDESPWRENPTRGRIVHRQRFDPNRTNPRNPKYDDKLVNDSGPGLAIV